MRITRTINKNGFAIIEIVIVILIIMLMLGGFFYFKSKHSTPEEKEIINNRNEIQILNDAKKDVNNIKINIQKQNIEIEEVIK